MRSFLWAVLGFVGWAVAYSTRSDQGYSTVRVVGMLLLATGSIKLLPRYPPEPEVLAAASEPTPELATASGRSI